MHISHYFQRHFTMNKQESSRGVSEDVNSTAETTVVKTKTEVITIKVEDKPEFINYPLWAKQIEPTSSKFQVHLHGVIVLRSKDDSSLRLRLLKTLLGGLSDDKDDEDDEVEKKQLQERLSWFFGKNVHGRHIEKVVLKLPGGDLEFIQPENVVTDPYGHYAIDFETELPGAKLGSSYQYEVVLAAGSDPQTEPGAFGIGRFQLLGFHGYSIVSDVDVSSLALLNWTGYCERHQSSRIQRNVTPCLFAFLQAYTRDEQSLFFFSESYFQRDWSGFRYTFLVCFAICYPPTFGSLFQYCIFSSLYGASCELYFLGSQKLEAGS